jgi:hypothetical protein
MTAKADLLRLLLMLHYFCDVGEISDSFPIDFCDHGASTTQPMPSGAFRPRHSS